MPSENIVTMKAQKKIELPVLVKGYLILYNFLLTLGWLYLLFQTFAYYLLGSDQNKSLYETAKYTLIIFQSAAILEIFHIATGIVPSNPFIKSQQIISRMMFLCGVLLPIPDANECFGFSLCLIAWSMAESIRYGYYALHIVNLVPQIFVWIRYSSFLLFVPMGLIGETLCFYKAYKYVAKYNMWSWTLPSPWNFTFSYQYVMIGALLLYLPIMPYFYIHMFAQMKKNLGIRCKNVEKLKIK